ncbi:hypothetical protein ACJ73_02776 [Blastomyces percursus]|uniref:CCHC-type domain-containing protein n=1 Tax=Blastomyces percursus TaxID=1658174 RepID=A0A1J9QAI8_9EURO|nr:hypothetical protein ACJ73_02776 [Blastomyces percursus]
MDPNANQGHVPGPAMNPNAAAEEFYRQLQALRQGQTDQQDMNQHLQTVLADIMEAINELRNANVPPPPPPVATPAPAQESALEPAAAAAAPPTVPIAVVDPTPKQKIKWGEKDTYSDKDKTTYTGFKLLLNRKLIVDWNYWSNDSERVMFMFSCFTGAARTRLAPWVQAHMGHWDFTPNEFWKVIDGAFYDQHTKTKALDRLSYLNQRKRPFRDFLMEIERLMLEAGVHGLEDDVKKSYVRNGLAEDLRKVMIGVEERETLEGYVQQLKSVSDRLEQEEARTKSFRQRKNGGWRPHQPFVRQNPAEPAAQNLPPPDPMDIGPHSGQQKFNRRAKWVSDAEKEKRKQAGLCFRCGMNGHLIGACPYLPARNPARAPDAMRIGALASPEPLLSEDEEDDEHFTDAEN